MRAVGTRITSINGLTRSVVHEQSPLPAWLVQRRLAENRTVRQSEEAFSYWHCEVFWNGNHATIVFYPTGLEGEILAMHEAVGGVA